MFQVFGNEVYSTDEICKILQNEYGITVITDLTKSTDRDDVIALKCGISKDVLNIADFDMQNENDFENALEKCNSYMSGIIDTLDIKYSLNKCQAYKYDEHNNYIKVIICIMYIETARKKLNDIFKRLLKNND